MLWFNRRAKQTGFWHSAGAFAILQFLVIHLYETNTGHSIFAHIRAMITGWEEVKVDVKIEDWEKAPTS